MSASRSGTPSPFAPAMQIQRSPRPVDSRTVNVQPPHPAPGPSALMFIHVSFMTLTGKVPNWPAAVALRYTHHWLLGILPEVDLERCGLALH